MAGNSESGFEMKAHQKDYAKFLWLFKYGTVITLVATAIVVLLIAN